MRGPGWGLTCSNSSVMVLGSSCLWNHIMYLVWNRHDCFFRALAARYCALVPWERKGRAGDQGPSHWQECGGRAGRQGGPRPHHRLRMGRTLQLGLGRGREHTSAGQKENETGGKCFQRSFEKEEKLMHEECSEEAAYKAPQGGMKTEVIRVALG